MSYFFSVLKFFITELDIMLICWEKKVKEIKIGNLVRVGNMRNEIVV